MAENKVPPGEQISASFKRLASASVNLNAAADELGQTVANLEVALKKLNLGVSAWHQIAGNENEDGYWTRDIGYAKVRQQMGHF